MEFDPEYGLVVVRTDLVTRHSGRASLEHARRLLAGGGAADCELAWRVVRRALDLQVLEEGHPHHGAFRFFDEDEEVTGLNVVSFVLQLLHAIWFDHADRLPADLRALILARVRLALGELERLDVHPRYTNPALMDAANCVVWGQILGDATAVAAGTGKLNRWIGLTAAAGAPYEFNSPNYLAVDLNMLALLAGHAGDPATRLKARLMEERVWLHAVLHYHTPTARLAGPHSRAYHRYMQGATDGVLDLIRQVVEGGRRPDARVPLRCPPHIAAWAEGQRAAYPYTVRETAGPAPSGTGQPADLATYFTAAYCLGTAGRTYTSGQTGFDIDHEANHCILHYRYHAQPDRPAQAAEPGDRDSSGAWRSLYTRFVTNDRYYGTIEQHALRTKQTNFYDQGLFAGHQHKNVAIALYGLELIDQGLSSVEALVVMPGPARPDALYAGGRALAVPRTPETQPVPLPDGEWILVEDGGIWVGILPLTRDQMGSRRGLELRALPTGELALAMPHYRGPEKWFWEYQSPHAAFYRRNIRSGCLLVVGERAVYPSLETFGAHLARAQVIDALDAHGVHTVGYHNADASLEIRYDLVRNETVERRLDGRVFTAPPLESPWAVQTVGRPARLGQATLDAGGAPCLLFARDAATAPGVAGLHLWEATILADGPHAVRLTTPAGTLCCAAFGFGAIRVEAAPGGAGRAIIRAGGRHAPIDAPPGMTITYDCQETAFGT